MSHDEPLQLSTPTDARSTRRAVWLTMLWPGVGHMCLGLWGSGLLFGVAMLWCVLSGHLLWSIPLLVLAMVDVFRRV